MVAITGVEDIGKGLIREGTGFVTFPVKYQCVVFRPFKGEILEAVVTMVNKVHPFSLSLYLSILYPPRPPLNSVKGNLILAECVYIYIFLDCQMGFFAEAGPVQIFVSNHVSVFLPRALLSLCTLSSLHYYFYGHIWCQNAPIRPFLAMI